MPVLHVKDNRFFIGSSVEKLRQKPDGTVEVEEMGPLDQYLVENHDVFEQTLIQLMYQGDKSLEEVVEFIINGKGVKTETVVLESPLKLRQSNWVSIDLKKKEDNKGYLRQSTKKIAEN